jgi:RimJ/RimL family protein N-acetyltransferase
MRLRHATLADLPALLDVQQAGAVRAFAHIFPQDRYPFPRDDLQVRWAEEIAAPDIEVYVIVDGGGIVGFAATRGDEFLHFGTAVETWGTGLAAAAHDEIVDRLGAAGVTRARLRVLAENRRARRFYEKLGWRWNQGRTRSPHPPFPVLLDYERDV